MKKQFNLILLLISTNSLFAQFVTPFTVFKPRIDVKSETMIGFQPKVVGHDGYQFMKPLFIQRSQVGGTIPLRTRVSTDIGLKINLLSSNPLAFSLKVKGSQTLLSIKAEHFLINHQQPDNNFDVKSSDFQALRFQVGISHIVMKKLRTISFYHIQASYFQDIKEKRFIPNAAAAIGQLRIKNLRTYYFYGLTGGYQNEKLFALPILGIDSRLTSKIRYNITLPQQIRVTYKKGLLSNQAFSAAIWTDGFGFIGTQPGLRADHIFQNPLYLFLKTGFGFEQKFRNKSRIIAKLGYVPVVYAGFTKNLNEPPLGGVLLDISSFQKRNVSMFFGSIVWQFSLGKGILGLGASEFGL